MHKSKMRLEDSFKYSILWSNIKSLTNLCSLLDMELIKVEEYFVKCKYA
jgi:hypothetical protein